MNSLEERLDCATTLLREVFTVCRAKSNTPTSDWHELRRKISEFIRNEKPDVEPYKTTKYVTKYRDERPYNSIAAEVASLKRENAKLKTFVATYQKREYDISRVLKSSLINRYKKETSVESSSEVGE